MPTGRHTHMWDTDTPPLHVHTSTNTHPLTPPLLWFLRPQVRSWLMANGRVPRENAQIAISLNYNKL